MNEDSAEKQTATDDQEVIECRPDRGQMVTMALLTIGCAILYGFFSHVFRKEGMEPLPPLARMLMGGIALLVIAVAIAATALLWRVCLRAETGGLRWRDWRGREAFVAWCDVTDYRSSVQGSRAVSGTVVGRDGQRFVFTHTWSNTLLIARRIKKKAVHASAHDWTQHGARSQDGWPRTFHYQTAWNRWAPWTVAPTAVGVFGCSLVSVFRSQSITLPYTGWGSTLMVVSLIALLFSPIAFLAVYLAIPDRLTRARWPEQITLSKDGIRFVSRDTVLAADWEDVIDARRAGVRGLATTLYTVVTTKGDFDFTQRIGGSSILVDALIYNAPRVRSWRLPEDENVLPTRYVSGSDVFVHHYRTRDNRAMLAIPSAMWSLPLLIFLMSWGMGVDTANPARLFGLCGVVLPFLLWLVWRYRAARVERDRDGLTFYGPFRTRHLLWSQMTDFRFKDYGGPRVFTIDSRAGRFVFYSSISERERLTRAIEAHLPSAVLAAESTAP